jgi:hypothetical protein
MTGPLAESGARTIGECVLDETFGRAFACPPVAMTIDSYLHDGEQRSLADDVLDGLTKPFKELVDRPFRARGCTCSSIRAEAQVPRTPTLMRRPHVAARRLRKHGRDRRVEDDPREAESGLPKRSSTSLPSTIPELANKMGIKQNYLYRVLPTLEQAGSVVKQGRSWHPKSGATN